ncbi:MAG TPA: serine/threonine protein kinase [Planctomycetes bacterium]|nr:serine/threonine protein kinase [Planctomycetota bacterium]
MDASLTLFDIVPGRTIADRFEVVRANRQGGFSTAFEIRDLDASEPRELQLFPVGLFEGGGQATAFRALLAPWLKVDSVHVLRVRELLTLADDILAVITDLPTGEPLRARLEREKSLTRDEVIALGTRMLEGLAEIHAQDLVHGDIKPNTIFVEGEEENVRPLLVDGGVTHGLWTAKNLGEKTALIGTPYYAPIEQFGGDAPDVRSDIYNVATVLYECATGRMPWAGKTFLDVFQSKLSDPPEMRSDVSDIQVDPELEAVIRKGCLADRNRRYASAAEFQAALEAIRD